MNDLRATLYEEFKDEEYAHAYCDEFLNMYVSTQIRSLREQRGWKQEYLAEQANMKQTRISLLESVNYSSWSVSTLSRIARAFDLRLKVSFEEFSTIIEDIYSFSRLRLERTSREPDIARAQRIHSAETEGSIVGLYQFAMQKTGANQYASPSGETKPSPLLEKTIPAGQLIENADWRYAA
jgi:transcriptional regulator with XRE-family HTH domain